MEPSTDELLTAALASRYGTITERRCGHAITRPAGEEAVCDSMGVKGMAQRLAAVFAAVSAGDDMQIAAVARTWARAVQSNMLRNIERNQAEGVKYEFSTGEE